MRLGERCGVCGWYS